MEGLLILIGIYLLDVVIQKVAAKKRDKQKEPYEVPQIEEEESEETQMSDQNLEDLIRQFEEAQRQATQGNIEPAVPPIPRRKDFHKKLQRKLPRVNPASPDCFTFKEIAESVIQWKYVRIEDLQQTFGFSEETSREVIKDLQDHHIIGHDMEGYCDLLIHDEVELQNLFRQREAEERRAKEEAESQAETFTESPAPMNQNEPELQLENLIQQMTSQTQEKGTVKASKKRTFNKAEIRRGFIWAKVLDEPRFKRQWSPKVR